MREILFRGKRTDNGEWVHGYYGCIGGMYHYIYTGKIDITKGFVDHEKYEVDFETVGQFTGLTCKNGKIFEGDILKDIWGKTFEMFFTTTSGGFMINCVIAPNEYDKGCYRIGDAWCDTISVIGNIHDNPELLKGEEK